MKRASEAASGHEIHALIAELYPIPVSITGNGVRHLLARLAQMLPGMNLHEVPTGAQVLDWTVPDEWNVRDAFIADATGRRVIDWQAHRLHLLQYSEPFRGSMPWSELAPHLVTVREHPEWIPYRTSYYEPAWGFCCSQNQFEELAARGKDEEYTVVVDATLGPGHLTYGEFVVPGETRDEILFSAHICHPQLANDNLASVAVAANLARILSESATNPRLTYRFLFAPGTIGALTWLAENRRNVGRIRGGLVLATLGDEGPLVYKRSRRGTLSGPTAMDAAVEAALGASDRPSEVRDFDPFGYDERQFCSPGFDLPVVRLSRTPHGEYPEYHTSADDLDFVTPSALADSLSVLREIIEDVEAHGMPHAEWPSAHKCNGDRPCFVNAAPFGEPQLGRRGLYSAIGGRSDTSELQRAIMWLLSLSDGQHDVGQIAKISGLTSTTLGEAANLLRQHELLVPVEDAIVGPSSYERPIAP